MEMPMAKSFTVKEVVSEGEGLEIRRISEHNGSGAALLRMSRAFGPWFP